MNRFKYPIAFLFILPSFLIVSCKPDSSSSVSPEEDTRLMVKAAYAKLDVMQVPASFNAERTAILEKKLETQNDQAQRLIQLWDYAQELLKCGRTRESLELIDSITTFLRVHHIESNDETKRNMYSVIGTAYLRLGETENCIQNHNHESCYIPVRGSGVHQLPFGSSKAIEEYTMALKDFPEDLEFKYLLNVAYMTLGKYPQDVPNPFLINPDWFKSKINYPRYKDIAPDLGVNSKGLAGGSVMDDFTNDGWLDIVATSWGPHDELVFYKNNGDGTFSDKTKEYGLDGQVGILNLNQADFNNDGWLDLLLLRGAWYGTQGDIPKTLLMNTGKGSFRDVTLKAGMSKSAPSQTAAWADYNLDGWLDVAIANESIPGFERGIDLYINQKDGSFSIESEAYGLTLNQFFKGCVATYANDDKYPDLYFSALSDSNSLFINQTGTGKNAFTDAGPDVHIGAPLKSFPCWSFDFDNNGYEDIFVSSYSNDATPVTFWMQSQMGTVDKAMLPKLYSHTGNLRYEEVGYSMGLTEVAFTMGCNFGDINTDGFLDFYLGTGNPSYQSLVPNKMYLNMDGKRFEDISYAGGFSNIQKGHGVSFGDLDHDGDEDLYMVIGGAVDGDSYFNSLFENPNPDHNNWVVLKLSGTKANKSAVGARVAISNQENGQERMIYRTVTSGASFGGNSLALEVGLRKSTTINTITVQWPCKECPDQVFSGLAINKAYELVQNQPSAKELPYTAVKMHGSGDGMMKHDHQMGH